jgi:hypothetical protein
VTVADAGEASNNPRKIALLVISPRNLIIETGPTQIMTGNQWVAVPGGGGPSGSITIDGDLSDIPTIHTFWTGYIPVLPPPSVDLSPLLALSIWSPDIIGVSLAFLVPPFSFGVVSWLLDPGELFYDSQYDGINVFGFGSNSTIEWFGPLAEFRATGSWDPVPEPATGLLFATGLAALALIRRRRPLRAIEFWNSRLGSLALTLSIKP